MTLASTISMKKILSAELDIVLFGVHALMKKTANVDAFQMN